MNVKYTQLTDEVVEAICTDIELGVSSKGACAVQGVLERTFSRKCVGDGDKPAQRPDWAKSVSGARGKAEKYWIGRLRDASKDTAMVKAAQIMLGALNPDRYRERPQTQGIGGILVQLIQGETGQVVEAKLVETGPKQGKKELLALAETVVE